MSERTEVVLYRVVPAWRRLIQRAARGFRAADAYEDSVQVGWLSVIARGDAEKVRTAQSAHLAHQQTPGT